MVQVLFPVPQKKFGALKAPNFFGAGEHSKSEPEASLLEASCISLKVIFFVLSL